MSINDPNTLFKLHATHAQYNLSTEDLDELERISLHFVHLFDKALHAQGIETRIGLEQEFRISKSATQSFDTAEEANAFAQTMQQRITESFKAANLYESERRTGEGSPTPSPVIERFEFIHPFTPPYKFGRFEVVTYPLRPNKAAVLGKAITSSLYHASQQGSQNTDTLPPHTPHQLIKRIREKGPSYHSVSFNPADDQSSYSQHVNVSHWVGAADKTQENLMTTPTYRQAMNNVLKHFACTDMALILPSIDSDPRLSRSHLFPHHLGSLNDAAWERIEPKIPQRDRNEFRLADASTDPFLNVLMNMAASYHLTSSLTELGTQPGDALSPVEKLRKGIKELATMQPTHDYASSHYLTIDERTNNIPIDTIYDLEQFTNFRDSSLVLPAMRKVAEQHGTPKDVQSVERFKELILARLTAFKGKFLIGAGTNSLF